MNQNAPVTIESFAAEFASHHVAKLVQLSRKVDEILAKPDPKLSELEAALRIELRIERYLYQLSQRQERAEKAKQPRTKRPEGGAQCPTAPLPAGRVPQSAHADSPNSVPASGVPSEPHPAPAPAPSSPLPKPTSTPTAAEVLTGNLCQLKNHGIKCEPCDGRSASIGELPESPILPPIRGKV